MGGQNESVLESEDGGKKKKNKGEILPVDEGERRIRKFSRESNVNPRQTQTIRQHVSGSECHFHDDENKLKVAVPVSNWHTALRQLQSGEQFVWVDYKTKTTGYFTPILRDGVLDIVIELQKIDLSERFEKVLSLAK